MFWGWPSPAQPTVTAFPRAVCAIKLELCISCNWAQKLVSTCSRQSLHRARLPPTPSRCRPPCHQPPPRSASHQPPPRSARFQPPPSPAISHRPGRPAFSHRPGRPASAHNGPASGSHGTASGLRSRAHRQVGHQPPPWSASLQLPPRSASQCPQSLLLVRREETHPRSDGLLLLGLSQPSKAVSTSTGPRVFRAHRKVRLPVCSPCLDLAVTSLGLAAPLARYIPQHRRGVPQGNPAHEPTSLPKCTRPVADLPQVATSLALELAQVSALPALTQAPCQVKPSGPALATPTALALASERICARGQTCPCVTWAGFSQYGPQAPRPGTFLAGARLGFANSHIPKRVWA